MYIFKENSSQGLLPHREEEVLAPQRLGQICWRDLETPVRATRASHVKR
jgi:hypothetical protein